MWVHAAQCSSDAANLAEGAWASCAMPDAEWCSVDGNIDPIPVFTPDQFVSRLGYIFRMSLWAQSGGRSCWRELTYDEFELLRAPISATLDAFENWTPWREE